MTLTYDGYVLTTIDVKPIDESNPNRVTFSHGNSSEAAPQERCHILKNVTLVQERGYFFGKTIFEADLVHESELKKSTEHPLLSIHGFNVLPIDHLKRCNQVKDKFQEKYNLIPIIWHSEGSLLEYFIDRGNSKQAGEEFRQLHFLEKRGVFSEHKSLMAHSMGNRVLRYGAESHFKFDNIYMIAADTDANMFHEEYIQDTNQERRYDGIRLKNMLKVKGGKIYVIHNKNDRALMASSVFHRVNRLGQNGVDQTKVHPDIQGKIENIDWGDTPMEYDRLKKHGYQFDSGVIEFIMGKNNA